MFMKIHKKFPSYFSFKHKDRQVAFCFGPPVPTGGSRDPRDPFFGSRAAGRPAYLPAPARVVVLKFNDPRDPRFF